MDELNEMDARILNFEERAPKSLGAKEDAIRKHLGISPVRYYQRLNQLIEDPTAIAEKPMLTARLRRLRDRRQAAWRSQH